MKAASSIISIALLLFTTVFFSCDNELDVTDDWKETTVIYGLLNPKDTVHIIKINKAFLGEGNAYMMAKEPDSTYYGDELEVMFDEIAPEGWITQSWPVDTIWVNTKDSGIFFSPQQKLYKVNAPLSQNNRYRIRATNTKTGNSASATTKLVNSFSIERPRSGQRFFSFTYQNLIASFISAKNGRVYQLVISFSFKEKDIPTGVITPKTIHWEFPIKKSSSLNGGEEIIVNFSGQSFYSFVASQLKANEDIERIPGDVTFTVYVGGDELSTYNDIHSPISTIVTERPDYTNVVNGIGLFSSRYYQSRTCQLTVQSVDSLINGSKTWNLGFVKPGP